MTLTFFAKWIGGFSMKRNSFLNNHIYSQFKKSLDEKAIIYLTSQSDPQVKSWTYQELFNAAQNLKNHILSRCPTNGEIKEGSVIGVAVNDYPDYIIALLAIWELNCIYMPLDPNPKCKDPKEWIITRLRLAGAQVFITNHNKFDQPFFSEVKDITHLEWEKIPLQKNPPNILLQTSLEDRDCKENSNLDTAYIYSSSGTSGTPKMIENTFEGLWKRVYGTADRLGIKTGSGILGYCAPDFDASLLDILMALSKGACLYPVYEAARTQLGLIKNIFEIANQEKPITSAVLTPVVLKSMKNIPQTFKSFSSLKTIITMGEECGIECLKDWFENNKTLQIFNGYGPTETTIAATVTKLDRDAFNNSTDEKSKEKNQNLLPMHHTLPGVELYFLEEKDNTSRVLNKSEIKELEASGKEVQIIIGGLGVGRYRKPASSNGNTEAEKLITQLNDEHFICQNEKEKWIYKQHGSDKDSKTIEIAGNNLPFKKGCRYYLTGDKVHITPSQTEIGYDLRFIARIDHAGKRNGIWISFDQVEKLIKENCKGIVEEVKVVATKNSFAAFIIMPPIMPSEKSLDEKENEKEFEEKFFKNLYRNKEEESRLLPSLYFLINPVAGSINNLKSAQTFKALLGEAKRWMIPRGKAKADTQSFNKIEQEIIKIWQSILFGDIEEISDFKKLHDQEAMKSLFTKESHFLHLGGDSLSIKNMIDVVWHQFQQSDAPQSFVNAVVLDPTLGNITNLIDIYNLIEISTYGSSKDYPLIFFQKIKYNYMEALREKTLCQIIVKNRDNKLDEHIVKFIEDKVRKLFPVGPYLLVERNKNPLIKPLSAKLRNSDFVKIINLKSLNQRNSIHLIDRMTFNLIEQSCVAKIKKWNDDFKQIDSVDDDKFPIQPNQDTWYQSAAYSGKTTYLAAYRRELWKKNEVWPIYLDVNGCWEKNIIDILFNKIGFCDKEIKYLKNKKILLMIDHYDRMLRNDVLDFRSNCVFKNWKNLTIWIVSRYLQIEKLTQDQNILMPNMNIITKNKQNYLSEALLKENKVTDFFEKYIKEEKLRHTKLQKLEIDVISFIHFAYYFFRPSLSVDKICIEKSPWEMDSVENDVIPFRRGHPYFIILRGLLSYDSYLDRYYFKDELIKLFNSASLQFTPKILDGEHKLSLESKRVNQFEPLTIENLEKKDRVVYNLPPHDQRIPVIAFYPLTGEVPKQYTRLFDMIGNFQPWLAFAMNVDRFKDIEEKSKSMDLMADYYANILVRLSAYFPSYILLGWSFGALLAFSVAEKLVRSKIKVDMIINIDCPPPSYLKTLKKLERSKLIISSLAKQEGYQLGSASISLVQKLVKESKANKTKEFFEEIKQALRLQSSYCSSFINMLERAEINLRAYYAFSEPQKIEVPLKVAVAHKRTMGLNDGAEYKEWEKFTSDLSLEFFNHNHFDIFTYKLATWIRNLTQTVQPLKSLVPFSERLRKYYDSVLENQPIFLDLNGSEDETSLHGEPLLGLCKKFIDDSNRHSLLIYGPSGSGKSTLLMKWARTIIEDSKPNRRVIYIKINSHFEWVQEEVIREGFSSEEYEDWKKVPTLIIMDGIENLQDKVNLWESNKLHTWSNVKLVLSCRYDALAHNPRIHHEYVSDQKMNCDKIYCLPLSHTQRDKYLAMHSTDSNNLWEKFKKLHIPNFIEDIFQIP